MTVVISSPTPLTLTKSQKIRVKDDIVRIYDDSSLTNPHYQAAAPNEPDNSKADLLWANLPSVEQTDGTYAIALQKYESVKLPPFGDSGVKSYIKDSGDNGTYLISVDGEKMIAVKNTDVTFENGNAVFKKLVWANSSELLLSTASQDKALKDKQKKEQEDLINKQIAGSGLGDLGAGLSSNTIIIIVAVLLVLGLIFWLMNKKKNTVQQSPQNSLPAQQAVNIVRIPKK